MTNTKCGGQYEFLGPSSPFYVAPKNPFGCGASLADVADLSLSVTINGATTTETKAKIPEVAVYELTSTANKTLDVVIFIPVRGIESGNIG